MAPSHINIRREELPARETIESLNSNISLVETVLIVNALRSQLKNCPHSNQPHWG